LLKLIDSENILIIKNPTKSLLKYNPPSTNTKDPKESILIPAPTEFILYNIRESISRGSGYYLKKIKDLRL
jgi:hypothetical protein